MSAMIETSLEGTAVSDAPELSLVVPIFNEEESVGPLIERIEEPFYIAEHEVFISASIGISMFPDDGADEQTLMRHADSAMYVGQANLGFFSHARWNSFPQIYAYDFAHDFGDEILAKITDSEFGLVALAWMDGGTRNLYTKKPVRKIEDLKGMKIRVQGNPLFIEAFNEMGANGIAMDTGEIFSALQTGVIDGAENNPPTLLEHNHFQSAKYYTLTGHLILPEPVVMSKTTWNTLTPEQQTLVKKVAREAQMEERALWDAKSSASEEKLKAAGVEFITVDKKPFFEATASVREKYGAPYADLMKRIDAVQ